MNNPNVSMARGHKLQKLVAVMVVLLMLGSVNLRAKDNPRGMTIGVEKKDGKLIKGELLKVQPYSLLIMDSVTLQGGTIDIKEIKEVRTRKKSAIMTGILSGVAAGVVGGVITWLTVNHNNGESEYEGISGLLEISAMECGVGTAAGALIGSLYSLTKKVSLDGASASYVDALFKKLNSKARFPQEWPGADQPNSAIKNLEDMGDGPEQPRFHLSFDSGYFLHDGADDINDLLINSRWGDFYPKNSPDTIGYYYGSYVGNDHQSGVHFMKNLKAEYSISKNFSLGIAYSPLYLPNAFQSINESSQNYYYKSGYCQTDGKGKAFFITGTYQLMGQKTFLRDWSICASAGAGVADLDLNLSSGYGYVGDPIYLKQEKTISKNTLCLMASVEYNYYITPNVSFGVNVEYKYVPFKVDAFQMQAVIEQCDYGDNYSYKETFYLIPADFPSRTINYGGFGFGMGLGVHL